MGEYWWILPPLLYLVLLLAVIRYGRWKTTGRTFLFASMCIIVLIIPFLNPPGSYVNAVLVVLNLSLFFRNIFRSETSSDR